MNIVDWVVLFGSLLFIVVYGAYKTRGSKDIEAYLLGNKTLPWWTVCLSIMATQASAITFLSTPGQAYEDGMRFLQFYFGLPLAMIILSVTAVPLYHRLKVYTAYEYLETRFDLKTRSLGALLFLLLRGLSVGITIYAPSLILSTILNWRMSYTILAMGSLVAIYTVMGGTRGVSLTQKYQMTIVMVGMLIAGWLAFAMLPAGISFGDTFSMAGELGKLNLVNLSFDLADRYNIWSGLIGGLFLFMSYFGTDQSQVGRYLAGSSVRESRLGLLFNGLLKVPMQFVILYIGILVFMFYQFNQGPVFHNETLKNLAMETEYGSELTRLENEYDDIFTEKRQRMMELAEHVRADHPGEVESTVQSLDVINRQEMSVRNEVKEVIQQAIPGANTLDKDYVFINFVMTYLPHGLIGLLLAVVFSAAMSSTASELNSLASTTTVDIYKRNTKRGEDSKHLLNISKIFTLGWVGFAMFFASIADQAENLIQFVNIIGSLFYGTILGIFLAAFYVKYIKSNAVFYAAIVAELVVLYCYFFTDVAYLLYNIIGCLVVLVLGVGIQLLENQLTSNTKG